MPKWLTIAIAVAVGGAIALGALIGGIFALVMWATSGLVEPIDRQNAALKVGDMVAAYAETSQYFEQADLQTAFNAFVEAHPALKDVASRNFSSRSFENDRGVVEGTLTSSTGGVTPVSYYLVKEFDRWKIIRVKLGVE